MAKRLRLFGVFCRLEVVVSAVLVLWGMELCWEMLRVLGCVWDFWEALGGALCLGVLEALCDRRVEN